MSGPRDLAELEDRLSEPSPGAVAALAAHPGDVVVLGAGGKMGPSLAVMARRAADLAGTARRVMAVSRFTDRTVAEFLLARGVEVHPTDLADPHVYQALPDAPNVVFMAGQKFGTQGQPSRTWYTNTVVPALAASRYRESRIVAFSTGNVYPLVPVNSGGSTEGDTPAPIGEYAQSCLGRERVFEYAADAWGTQVSIIRLNYAVDLRYGVLVDIARRVMTGQPVDLRMGWVNCIWQGDANAMALAAFGAASTPPLTLNLTGSETLSVRDVALAFGRYFAREVVFSGNELPDALLSNTTRMQQLFGRPRVDAETLMRWVAEWVGAGGTTSGKPTHFEQREGTF